MKTLAEIINLGNAEALAGRPLVSNWPQTRGALLMIGHACGGLERFKADTFEAALPEDFEALDLVTQDAFPNAAAYSRARKLIWRLLVVTGEIEDLWERLRMMIRNARRGDIEYHWGGLKTPATEAGLAPSEIRSDWVWSLDAEKGAVTEAQMKDRKEREAKHGTPGSTLAKNVRQRLRRSVSLFNELFEISDIASSGLLPREPIGPPPVYDNKGRPKVSLPASLAQYQACRPDPDLQGLPQVWQAMCGSGIFNLPENPSADDLLTSETWTLIETLPHSVTGYAESTWRTYLLRTRATLLTHALSSAPERLPERFETMIESDHHRWPIQALWRQICHYAPDMEDTDPDELLVPATWSLLWQAVPDGVTANTWKQYEKSARNILVRQGRYYVASYNHVTQAWADLPRSVKADLNPIRKVAEDTLLRPLDITPAWLSGLELDAVQRSRIEAALCDVFFSAVQVRCAEPLPDPVSAAWSVFRKAVRDEGLDGSRLGIIAKAATKDRKTPSALTHEWAVDVAEALSDRGRRAKVSLAIRNLDAMLGNQNLASLLYSNPIGALPDQRKRGMVDPPKAMLRELGGVHDVFERAHSTRREGRSVLRKLWTAAVASSVEVSDLGALLATAATLEGIDRRTRTKGTRLLEDLRSVQRDV